MIKMISEKRDDEQLYTIVFEFIRLTALYNI